MWKTYMGRNRNVGTLAAFGEIYRQAGGGFPGVAAFWAGTGPKVCLDNLWPTIAWQGSFHLGTAMALLQTCCDGCRWWRVHRRGPS